MTPTPRDDPARMIDRDNPDAPPIVAMRDIRKVYNPGTSTEVEVLHGIDLQIRAREFVALIGPSGSGKSTLLNLLGLLERPTSGEYRLDGEPLAALDDAALTARRNARIGFVFQFHHLLPAFTALENVTLPLLIRDGHVDAAARAQGAQLLDAVGLAGAHDRKPRQLSGGMQQRVAVARALAGNPAIVLADEPTGNLDTRSSDEVFALMRRFHRERGTAFLIVTHDPRMAERCDRVLEMQDGRWVSDRRSDPPADLPAG